MTVDPMALGALASSMLGALGYVSWRFHRVNPRTSGAGLFRLADTYVRGQADAARERERRATIVATVAALPPGATLVDQRADGATLSIRIPTTLPPSREPVAIELRHAAE
jgi:hypothetical protein